MTATFPPSPGRRPRFRRTLLATGLAFASLLAPAAPGQTATEHRPATTIPTPRGDENSRRAHQQLLAKARQGTIDLYFLGDSITRRWGCTDPQWSALMENWKKNFHGWNAANFGWGADGIEHILWRVENGELEGMTVDKLHLSAKGYQVWADALEPLLLESLGPRSKEDRAPPPTGDPKLDP